MGRYRGLFCPCCLFRDQESDDKQASISFPCSEKHSSQISPEFGLNSYLHRVQPLFFFSENPLGTNDDEDKDDTREEDELKEEEEEDQEVEHEEEEEEEEEEEQRDEK
jgi:hypothetical protein